MSYGNKPVDGGHLLLARDEVAELGLTPEQKARFIRRFYGSAEFIRGLSRYCLWIEDQHLDEALKIPSIRKRIETVRAMRLGSRDKGANQMASRAHQFREMNLGIESTIVVPSRFFGESPLSAGRLGPNRYDHRRPKFRALRRSTLEHGADRVTASLGLDRDGLCSVADGFLVFKHLGLEHLPPCRCSPRRTGRT